MARLCPSSPGLLVLLGALASACGSASDPAGPVDALPDTTEDTTVGPSDGTPPRDSGVSGDTSATDSAPRDALDATVDAPSDAIDLDASDSLLLPPDTAIGDAGPPPVDDGVRTRSGTRLRVLDVVGEDGTRLPVAFFDTKLGIRCLPSDAAGDGTPRCYPIVGGTGVDETLPGVLTGYFTDSACTTAGTFASLGRASGFPAACAALPAPVGYRVMSGPPGSCASTIFQFFEIGAPVKAYQLDPVKGCIDTATSSIHYDALSVPGTLAPSEFVAFSAVTGPGTDQLAASLLVGDDGSRYWDGTYVDKTLHTHCKAGTASDGALRCIPIASSHFDPASRGGWFVGTTCTGTRAITARACDLDKGYATGGIVPDPACSTTYARAFTLGATPLPATTTLSRLMLDGSCVTDTVGTDLLYPLDAEVLPAALAPVVTSMGGAGRLHVPMIGAGTSAAEVPTPAWPYWLDELYDATLGTACIPSTAADGRLRCMPRGGPPYFTDAACSKPIAVWQASCGAPVPSYTTALRLDGCDETRVSRKIGATAAAPTGPLYLRTDTGACTTATLPTGSYQFGEVGPELPPSTFVALSFGVE